MRKLTNQQVDTYHRDGYLHLPGFFETQEFVPIQEALETDARRRLVTTTLMAIVSTIWAGFVMAMTGWVLSHV